MSKSKPIPKTAAEKTRDLVLRKLEQLNEEQQIAILAEASRVFGYGAEAAAFFIRLSRKLSQAGAA